MFSRETLQKRDAQLSFNRLSCAAWRAGWVLSASRCQSGS